MRSDDFVRVRKNALGYGVELVPPEGDPLVLGGIFGVEADAEELAAEVRAALRAYHLERIREALGRAGPTHFNGIEEGEVRRLNAIRDDSGWGRADAINVIDDLLAALDHWRDLALVFVHESGQARLYADGIAEGVRRCRLAADAAARSGGPERRSRADGRRRLRVREHRPVRHAVTPCDEKAWRWYPANEWTVVLFRTGWWLRKANWWHYYALPPGLYNLRLGPLLLHYWRRS